MKKCPWFSPLSSKLFFLVIMGKNRSLEVELNLSHETLPTDAVVRSLVESWQHCLLVGWKVETYCSSLWLCNSYSSFLSCHASTMI